MCEFSSGNFHNDVGFSKHFVFFLFELGAIHDGQTGLSGGRA